MSQVFDIAFLGDSLSCSWFDRGWKQEMDATLRQGSRAPTRLYNCGLTGENAAWGLAHVANVTVLRPRGLIIAFGMNDAATDSGDFSTSTIGTINAVKSACPDTSIFLMTMDPPALSVRADLSDVATRYAQYRTIAASESVGLIDTALAYAQTPDSIIGSDGVHPPLETLRAYLIPTVLAALRPLLATFNATIAAFGNPIPDWTQAGAAFDLDFTTSRYYGGALNDLMAVSRVSSGYAKTSVGTLLAFANNVPRITDLGLRAEEPQSNLVTQSQALDLWPTVTGITVTADTSVAPDGTTTADTLKANTASTSHFIAPANVTFASGFPYTFSIYAVKGTHRYLQIAPSGSAFSGSSYATFDLQTGTVANSNGGTASIEQVGSFYRCKFTVTSNASATTFGTILCLTDGSAARAPTWTAAGTETVIVWGMQVESRAFVTSLTPTLTSSAPRDADAATLIGDLATLLGSSAFSVLLEIAGTPADAGTLLGGATTFLDIASSTTVRLANGANNLDATLGSGTASAGIKVAFGVDGTGRSVVANNGTVATDTNSKGTWSTLGLGNSGSGGSSINTSITRLTAWNSRLPDATLKGLTA